ncbi:MAG: hypothetical protein KatS3mg108_2774 [Isosphaeraceae bacterium]|jgi:DNA-binding NtrC family response regulator|nr:MAG: hypothetical protein KatS3mg108_2774 [Isosphaeraceae bacterium]
MSRPSPLPLIIHEPRTFWARQLRARSATWPVHCHETRSLDDLLSLLPNQPFGLLVIDSGNNPASALEHLAAASLHLKNWLILFIVSHDDPQLATLARTLGASHVVASPIPPPVVASLLHRWLKLSLTRRDRSGWVGQPNPSADAWLDELLPSPLQPTT